ncbi:phospholipase [Lithospermum erythrorhizon]|uniref:Phospholipase n=1 Tax=Lithospermum erythrorhizon TaxID=34254 RepID=A0AAV3NXL5_LITER
MMNMVVSMIMYLLQRLEFLVLMKYWGLNHIIFGFDRLDVRVPTILISPWIERGTVLHEPSGPYPTSEFEHSSIPATVKKMLNLNEFLTKRDSWAGTFDF